MTVISKEAVERQLKALESAGHSPRMGTIPMIRGLSARIEELEAALRDVRHEICKGPIHDTLWHQIIPAETTVDFICNTLDDDWDYDAWLAENDNAGEASK